MSARQIMPALRAINLIPESQSVDHLIPYPIPIQSPVGTSRSHDIDASFFICRDNSPVLGLKSAAVARFSSDVAPSTDAELP